MRSSSKDASPALIDLSDAPPASNFKVASRWRTALASVCIFGNAITAAPYFTFPLFGPSISTALDLTMKQTSTIATSAVLSCYLTGMIWGMVADRKGPSSISLASAILNGLGFTLMSSTLANANSSTAPVSPVAWLWMVLYYAMVGSGCAAAYFSAVISSAKLFPSSPGLSIGVPCALFGLSPLLLAQIGNTEFREVYGDGRPDMFDAVGYLRMLAMLLVTVNIFGAVGMRLAEQAPPTLPVAAHADSEHDHGDLEAEIESTPLLGKGKQAAASSPLWNYVCDPAMWMLGFALLLASGPGDMVMSCLGAVVGALVPAPSTAGAVTHAPSALSLSSRHVQIISLVNTTTRIVSGWLSDRLTARGSSKLRRLAFLGVAPVLLGLASFWTAFGLNSPQELGVLSVSTGVAYGIIFTLVPSIVATVWPLADFGRNWGLLFNFSAVGSTVHTLLFGALFDLASPKDGSQCLGRHCFEAGFVLSGISELLALGLVGLLWRVWRRQE